MLPHLEFFLTASDGHELRHRFCDDGAQRQFADGCLGELADVYTTYSPDNAARILHYNAQDYRVAACSDLAMTCGVSTDSDRLGRTLYAQRVRCVDHGGYRCLNNLDMLHYMFHAHWRLPGFKFSPEYFSESASQKWVDSYPLNAFSDFLGLNRTYSAMTVACWVDYRRFQIGGDTELAEDYFDRYMMVEGPSPQLYSEIINRGPLEVMNDPDCLPAVRRWLLACGTWSGADLKHPMLQRLMRCFGRHYTKMHPVDRNYAVAKHMTELAVRYLYIHHMWLVSGGRVRFNPYHFFPESPDVAQAYVRTFPPG